MRSIVKILKKVKRQPRRSIAGASRGASPWMVMGALVASTAMGAKAVEGAEIRRPRTSYSSALPAAAPAKADDQQTPAVRFDIPAGPLDAAIRAFEVATNLKLDVQVPVDTMSMVQVAGLSGRFTPEEGLRRLLAGSGMVARETATGGYIIEIRVAEESVEVRGRMPSVASPKFTEPLRDVPQTITVIPAAVMQQQGAVTLRDVLRNVSGITFQAGEGGVPAGDNLTIRGFSARTDMFVDGVRDFGGYSRDAFNLEQVEVAKGPSSAIAGRGSTGGAINQVSKTPGLTESYSGSIGFGNAAARRSTLDINQPIEGLGHGAAFRINAMFTDTEVPGRDEVSAQRWGVAPSLAFGVGTPTRLTLSYFHLSQDNLSEYGLPWVPANTNPALEAYSNGIPPVDQSNFYGLKSRDYEDTLTRLATVQFDHDFTGAISLRNLTRYGTTERDSVITAPRFVSVNTSTDINRQLQSRDMTDKILANQTNVTSRFRTGALQHALVTGVEVSSESSENFGRSGPTAPTTDLFNPNPNDPYPGPITRNGAFTNGKATSAAAYAFETLNLSPQWELTGGLRWDRFDVDYDALSTAGVTTDLSRTDSMVSWRGGLVYKPRVNGSVYFGYGTSLNPSAEGLALSDATVTLDPERTRTYELGTKWDTPDGRASFNAAVFRTEKTNARTPGLNPGDPPTVLAGEQVVDGVELGVSGRLTSRWTTFGTVSFLQSDITASNTATELDNALALTPERTFNIWTTYALPRGISAGGGLQYMDSVFRNATNTASVPSYWLVNALASYEVNTHLTLRLNGNNLADEQYVDRVGGGHYIPGPGRQVMISADVKY
jgi:catecholate siderophore receptor